MKDPRAAIRERARAIGFDAVGFAPAALADRARDDLASFVAAGRHGTMDWLARDPERRGDPKGLWPEARSVVVLAQNYGPEDDPRALLARRDRANISVYARNRDYHDLIKGRLKQLAGWMHGKLGCEVKVFVDTAPVMEKPLAALAGLGWQGKHTNLVSRDFGSWLFLGSIFTTLDLPADQHGEDHCGACRRCLDACPTGALDQAYRIDARRCISYLTIEHAGPIDRDLRPLMGNRIYGCDDCLAACPWNKFAEPTAEPAFLPRPALAMPHLAELAELDDAGFRALFSASPVKRVGRDRFLRNVLIAIGNSGERALLPAVRRRLDDDAPVVRGTAVWALSRLLSDDDWQAERARCLPAEPDAEVRAEWLVGRG